MIFEGLDLFPENLYMYSNVIFQPKCNLPSKERCSAFLLFLNSLRPSDAYMCQ